MPGLRWDDEILKLEASATLGKIPLLALGGEGGGRKFEI
jgi:hypothetical protein